MISIQIEFITANIVDLAPLIKRQWQELGEYKTQMPLAMDFGLYIVQENQGRCFMVTARDDGNLVGYYICQVQGTPHHMTTLSGCGDFVWVAPEARGSGLGQRLLDAVESELRRRAAKIWLSASRMSGNAHNHMDKLLTLNGFAPLDLMYAKWIG